MVTPDVERENRLVLAMVPAMLGLISRNVLLIAIQREGERTILRFWVREDNPETTEDIRTIVSRFEAQLTEEKLTVETVVEVGPPPPFDPARPRRTVYRAKGA